MLKIEANITVIITDEDVHYLRHVCELARRYIRDMGAGGHAEWDYILTELKEFQARIFEYTTEREVKWQ